MTTRGRTRTYPVDVRPILILAAIPVLAAALAGCSEPRGEPPETRPAMSPSQSWTGSMSPSAGLGVLSDFRCAPDENGVWRGKATLRNVGSSPNTYTVQFSVVRTADSQVIGVKKQDFTVEPGESVDVAFPTVATSSSSGLECQPSVTAQPVSPAPSGSPSP
ncbi:hypothetical protein AHIS1636_23380 [Arthrobacter mangrovi]|uniref:Uncharacterized protein n=1 Tax=Arthrobacter mangrovi TaxID=2966350 RepID=A0ABQ5MVB8_9MICC|nr:hypothetical protein AHIS1636_23380 [Arthrobacter mangrovi]